MGGPQVTITFNTKSWSFMTTGWFGVSHMTPWLQKPIYLIIFVNVEGWWYVATPHHLEDDREDKADIWNVCLNHTWLSQCRELLSSRLPWFEVQGCLTHALQVVCSECFVLFRLLSLSITIFARLKDSSVFKINPGSLLTRQCQAMRWPSANRLQRPSK